jgi:hypothetical protein
MFNNKKTADELGQPKVPRLKDYVKMVMQLRAKAAPGFFGQTQPVSTIPLDPKDTAELVNNTVAPLPLNDAQKERLRKVVEHWLSLVPGGAKSNQVKELVNFTQTGNATVPGYKPTQEQGHSLKR